MENKKVLNDNELENVTGGIGIEGVGECFSDDYSVVYKKDNNTEWEPDVPTNAGTYKAKIALDDEGNY